MRTACVIGWRDFRTAFYTPVAYGLLSVFVCITGYFFFNLLGSFNFAVAEEARVPVGEIARTLNLNEWVVQGFYQTVLLLLIFIVPLVTMRVISDERQFGTYVLLQSLPLTPFQVFCGKFIGCFSLVFSMLLLACILPLALCVLADPEVLPVLTGMAGLFLAAAAFVAIGVAVSACFHNALLSGVVTLACLILLYGVHSPAESLSPAWQQLLRYLSPLWQLRDLFRGVITAPPVAYFMSLIVISFAAGTTVLFRETRDK